MSDLELLRKSMIDKIEIYGIGSKEALIASERLDTEVVKKQKEMAGKYYEHN